LIAAWALFAASVVGALVGVGVFLRYDTDFWDHFEPAPVLRLHPHGDAQQQLPSPFAQLQRFLPHLAPGDGGVVPRGPA
jgi:hypothetical protein